MTRKFRFFNALTGTLALLLGISFVPAAVAGPFPFEDAYVVIDKNPTPLNTTPVPDPNPNTGSFIPFDGGQMLLEDYAGDPLTIYEWPDPNWWNNSVPGDVYTTHTAGIIIDFVDLNVTGFTFNLGANKNARAWIKAYYEVDGQEFSLQSPWFQGIGPNKTPGFGVYVKDPQISCAQITRVEIDPQFEWGVGNFGIAQNSCGTVPEPDSTTILGTGLLAIAMGHQLLRRRSPRLVRVDTRRRKV